MYILGELHWKTTNKLKYIRFDGLFVTVIADVYNNNTKFFFPSRTLQHLKTNYIYIGGTNDWNLKIKIEDLNERQHQHK